MNSIFAPVVWSLRTTVLLISIGAVSPTILTAATATTDDFASRVYGNDYQQFVKARRAQLQGDYRQATQLYEQVESPALRAVARVEIAACHEASNDIETAITEYIAAIEDAAAEALLGDALVRLASLQCLRGEYDDAHALLDRAIQWHEQRGERITVDEPTEDPPDIGNISPDLVSERTVLHPSTTPWLMPHLHVEALTLKIFVQSLAGDTLGALATCEALETLHTETESSLRPPPSMQVSLQDEVRRGAFVLPKEAWDTLSTQHAPKLRFGFFYLAVGGCDRATQCFSELDRTLERGGGAAMDWSAACLGLGLSQIATGETAEAIATLDRFRTLFLRSPLAPLGQLALANAHAGTSKGYDDAIRIYGDVANQFSRTGEAERALLAMALCASNRGDYAAALEARQRLQREYEGTPAAMAANSLGEWTRNAVTSAELTRQSLPRDRLSSISATGRGKASYITHVQKDVPVNSPELALVGLRYSLSPLEPQLPQQPGPSLRLFRSELLLDGLATSTLGDR